MKAYIFLTAVTLSIDTLAVGAAYGVQKARFSLAGGLAFLLTGLVTVSVSGLLGKILTMFAIGRAAGALMLTVTGLLMAVQQLGILNKIPLFSMLSHPEDAGGIITPAGSVWLALALSADSSVACIGCTPIGGGLLLPILIFLFQPLFMTLGMAIGKNIAAEGCEKLCGIAAGLLLMALGTGNLIFF